jgi:DHA1 family multidrug resistance protein-like MFS transporter/DHA1 family quinolone resistance protein-like MFS transporter
MYTYFIPVFAQTLGASFLDLGLIGAAYSITYAVIPMVAGHLADRFNRVWLFSLAITIIILGTWALTLSRTVLDIAFIRSVTGFAFAVFLAYIRSVGDRSRAEGEACQRDGIV